MMEEREVWESLGEEGFGRLIHAFYRQVPSDDILGPMYEGRNLSAAEERLRDFLIGRFGGPPRYIEQRGHPRLRVRHHPFAIDQRARDRWVELMDRALDEAALPAGAAEVLRRFFHDTATFLINRPSPPAAP
jgi:hemoglobin